MPTKRTHTPSNRRAPIRRAPKQRPATKPDHHDRPIPDIARRFAENIVRRMWPTLYVKAMEAAPTVTRGLMTFV
jgi:hypothetical protein